LDVFMGEHAALRDFEIALREVLREMALHQRPATATERERVRECWEFAGAYYRNNKAERESTGWAADDLEEPPPWWRVEAELTAVPPLAIAAPDGERIIEQTLRRLGLVRAPERRGRKEHEVSRATKATVAEMRISGATVAEIMQETKLTKTVAARLVRMVDGVLGDLRAGRY
jgi:hypothetical protein